MVESIPRQYIDDSVKDLEQKFDHHYGLVHDYETEKIYLGETPQPVTIIGKEVKVAGISYPGTAGSYKLLFKKEPVGYKQGDLDNYMDILKNEQVQGNGSYKYVYIIGSYL